MILESSNKSHWLDDGQASRSLYVNISSHRLEIEIEINYDDTLPKLLGSVNIIT